MCLTGIHTWRFRGRGMEEIVEAALEQRLADAVDEPGDDERTAAFGPPQCALIGCGEEGVARIGDRSGVRPGSVFPGTTGEPGGTGLTTVAVGAPSKGAPDAVDHTVPVRPADPRDVPVSRAPPGPTLLEDALAPLEGLSREWDVVGVTAHLDDPATTRLVAAVCRTLPSDATVLVVPTVPPDGLSPEASTAFRALVEAAGTTIPCDLARVSDAYASPSMPSPGPSSQGVLGTADDVVGGLVDELLGLFRSPPTTPVNTVDARALLSTGGVAVTYHGWGTREDIPEALLDHAATHRLCDGDGARADGILGLLRAGPTLELREYDALYEHVSAEIRPPYVGRERWIRACRTTGEFEDACTLLLLLTGVDPESLPFLETERVS